MCLFLTTIRCLSISFFSYHYFTKAFNYRNNLSPITTLKSHLNLSVTNIKACIEPLEVCRRNAKATSAFTKRNLAKTKQLKIAPSLNPTSLHPPSVGAFGNARPSPSIPPVPKHIDRRTDTTTYANRRFHCHTPSNIKL